MCRTACWIFSRTTTSTASRTIPGIARARRADRRAALRPRSRPGLTSLEVGSDIGGSIRNPAHYSGVFGHKPTFDIVASDRLAPPPSVAGIDLAVAGPLARSAEDLDVTLRLLVGPGRLNRAVRVELPKSQRKLQRVSSRAVAERCSLTSAARDRRSLSIARRSARSVGSKGIRQRAAGVLRGARSVCVSQAPERCDESSRVSSRIATGSSSTRNARACGSRGTNSFVSGTSWCVRSQRASPSSICMAHIAAASCASTAPSCRIFSSCSGPGSRPAATCRRRCSRPGLARRNCRSACRRSAPRYADLQTIEFARLVTQEFGGFQPPPGLD